MSRRAADLVWAVGSVIFALALVPSVLSNNPPSLATALLTAAVLSAYAVVYTARRYPLAGVTTLLSAGLWWTLTVQAAVA